MKIEKLSLVIVIATSLLLIFFRFNDVPKELFFDEVEFARLALSLDSQAYTPYSTMATGHSTLYFYTLLSSFKLFGVNNAALRLPSALAGFLSIILFYQIMKIVSINGFLATLTTLLFATSRWFFSFARFSFEATFLLFWELGSIYFLFSFFERGRTWRLVLSFLFAGLAYNSYAPGRIFFVLIFAALVLTRLTSSRALTKRQLGTAIAIFTLTILPLTSYLLQNPDIRFNQQFFLKNHMLTIGEKAVFLADNIKRATFMFVSAGDMNGRHNYPGKPALNPLLLILFLAGAVRSLKNMKNFYNQFFLLYFVFGMTPMILTYPHENPNMLRSFTALPSIAFFAGVTLESVFNTIEKLKIPAFRKARKKYLVLALLTVAVLSLTASSAYEIRTYFKYQKGVYEEVPWTTPRLEEAEDIVR